MPASPLFLNPFPLPVRPPGTLAPSEKETYSPRGGRIVDEEIRELQGTPLVPFRPVVSNSVEQSGEAGQQREKVGTGLVTVLYSIVGDVYKVPSANVDLWLSVQV